MHSMQPDNNRKPVSIGVYFFHKPQGLPTSMRYLPSTSDYLTEIQFIPSKGDWLSIQSSDWSLLGIEATETVKSVMMVESRVVSFGFVDIGIICKFQEWMGEPVPEAGWQQIPLN